MIKIELFHPRLQTASIDNSMPAEQICGSTSLSWYLEEIQDQVTINFKPIDIVPNLRINDFLINHWLADVQVDQGQLRIALGQDFTRRYKDKDIQGRKSSLGYNPTAIILDRNIGTDLHEDLIGQIRHLINEKSNLNQHTID